MTEAQKYYLEELVERSDAIKSGSVDPIVDNMLKITGEARKLAIDMRLIDPAYTLADNQKILQVVDNVERIYREGAEDKATQMIFSDIGTPKSKEEGLMFTMNSKTCLWIEDSKDQIALSMTPILMKRKLTV